METKWTCKWILPNTGLDIRATATYYELAQPQKQANFHECTQLCIYRLSSSGSALFCSQLNPSLSRPNANNAIV